MKRILHRLGYFRENLLRVLTVALLISLGGGCGGSGDSTSPTEPDLPPAQIDGAWLGTASSTSASGTCFADSFGPVTVSARWIFDQTGASFTGSQTLNNAVTCPFRGTVDGASATIFATTGGANVCTVQVRPCPGTRNPQFRLELQTDRPVLQGGVTNNTMMLTGTSVWRVTNNQTGEFIGTFEVRGTQELERE